MRRKFKLSVVLIFIVYLMVSNTIPSTYNFKKSDVSAIENEEIKALWVSTVFGLDFPKTPTINSVSLKAELDSIIKNTKNMGFNTIFFQVRPSCDAFYKSDIYPWSKYLTGSYNTPPSDSFDPLEYFIEKAHENNISLHAWINPYRVTASTDEKDYLTETSPAKIHSDWVIEYNEKLYFNPGIPAVNDFIAEGVSEIIKKYNVDGIQLDDYFYPGQDFNDEEEFIKYGSSYSDKSHWRRDNITSLIDKLSKIIKEENPKIIFSVSPQGIWANAQNISGGSDTNGKEAYFSSYADTKKWVKENKIDYIIPQIYWNIGYAGADFKVLSKWWNDVVEGTNVKLIIGQAAYKVVETTDISSVWYKNSGTEEIKRQIDLLRSLKNVSGYAMFRYSHLCSSPDLMNAAIECNTSSFTVFKDLSSVLWAKDDITELHEKGIVTGVSQGIFAPGDMVTRGQFAVMISRLLDKETDFTDNFSDVESDMYYYVPIGTLKKLGLINGIDENNFAPENNISRQDMATMIYRILVKEQKIIEENNINHTFNDDDKISDYAKTSVYTLNKHELLTGYDDGSFKPFGNATRAECSVFLNRIRKFLNK